MHWKGREKEVVVTKFEALPRHLLSGGGGLKKTVNQLTLFKEIIAVYCENHMKLLNALCGQNADSLMVSAGGIYSYQLGLRD
jgi:hypothetical protein